MRVCVQVRVDPSSSSTMELILLLLLPVLRYLFLQNNPRDLLISKDLCLYSEDLENGKILEGPIVL